MRWFTPVLAAALCAACGAGTGPNDTQAAAPPAVESAAVPAPAQGPSFADRIRDWKARTAGHFSESADVLGELAASPAADDAALRSSCQRLHDTNSVGLQQDLPSPDPGLTDELQRMIDDMNTATHACMRYALGGVPAEAATYQNYLARAVTHLQRAKAILNAVEK